MVRLLNTRGQAVRERIELSRVKERDGTDHLRVSNAKVSSIGVAVRLAVLRCNGGVEEGDHHVAICIDTAHRRHQRCCQVSVEWAYDLVEEGLPIGADLRQRGRTDDRPLGLLRQKFERAARTRMLPVEARLSDCPAAFQSFYLP